jgi:hypothetical protein
VDDVLEIFDVGRQRVCDIMLNQCKMIASPQWLHPSGDSSGIVVIDGQSNLPTFRGLAIPIRDRLDQVMPQETRSTRNQQVLAGNMADFLLQVGYDVSQIILNDIRSG